MTRRTRSDGVYGDRARASVRPSDRPSSSLLHLRLWEGATSERVTEYYRVYRYAFEVVNSPLVTVDSGGGVSEADSEDEAEAVHSVAVLTQSNNFCDRLTGAGRRTRTRTYDRLIAIQFYCIPSSSSAALFTCRNVPAQVKKALIERSLGESVARIVCLGHSH